MHGLSVSFESFFEAAEVGLVSSRKKARDSYKSRMVMSLQFELFR